MAGKKENIEFGLRLQRLRMERGLNRYQLSKKINGCTTSIEAYENAAQSPSTRRVRELALALEVSVETLTGGIPEEELDKHFPKPRGWLREQLALRDWHDKTIAEIAEELGVDRHSVEQAINKMRKKGVIVAHQKARKGPEPKPKPKKVVKPEPSPLKPGRSKRVYHIPCKGCIFFSAAEPCCEFYYKTGRRRQYPVNGKCPDKRIGKKGQNKAENEREESA